MMFTRNITPSYRGQNLQGVQFRNLDLRDADFSGADLRGADFSFTNLEGAHFVKAVFGIKSTTRIGIFILCLALSFLSGYMAMLAGTVTQKLLQSPDLNYRITGYTIVVFFVLITGVALIKGIGHAISRVLVSLILLSAIIGVVNYLMDTGTGMGALYGIAVLVLLAMMFIIGTIARSTIGTLESTVLFIMVAVGGGMFGTSLGGGIGTMVMAAACAIISKRALSGKRDAFLKQIAFTITAWFGTSFRGANLNGSDFTEAIINNTNFSKANLTNVNLTNAKINSTLHNHRPD